MKLDTIKHPPITDDYISDGMSNFDHTIPEGFAEALQTKPGLPGDYSAWNFHAQVWWDGEQFVARVRRYCVDKASYRCLTLKDMMQEISDDWGWD